MESATVTRLLPLKIQWKTPFRAVRERTARKWPVENDGNKKRKKKTPICKRTGTAPELLWKDEWKPTCKSNCEGSQIVNGKGRCRRFETVPQLLCEPASGKRRWDPISTTPVLIKSGIWQRGRHCSDENKRQIQFIGVGKQRINQVSLIQSWLIQWNESNAEMVERSAHRNLNKRCAGRFVSSISTLRQRLINQIFTSSASKCVPLFPS